MTRGLIIKYEFGVFLPPSWISVFLGQNLFPRGYDRRADAAPEDVLVKNAASIREEVRLTAQRTPDHRAFLGQIGALSGTAPLVAGG